MFVPNLAINRTRKCGRILLDGLTFVVFLFLDFLDAVLCVAFKVLDEMFEGKASPCYCGKNKGEGNGENIKELSSESLYGRENVFRKMGFLGFARKWEYGKKKDHGDHGSSHGGRLVNKWSDCGCHSCVSWMKSGYQKLHVVVTELPQVNTEVPRGEEATENVIFLHGFLSSSSFWTETVFKNVSGPVKGHYYKLFGVDLLGFGRSPKPSDSMYTLSDHVEMIEKSVISPFQLSSFHLVAHSMGGIIALALAAKYSELVKSVTLVATPYLPSAKDAAITSMALNKLAGKTLWPPLAFGKSVMSWYEHIGRCVCFLFCRNHRIWETILKLLTLRRELNFLAIDLTRHTHHSAWHSMHNVICGGAKFMDDYLEILIKSRVKICVIHGDQDLEVPLECSKNMKMKFPEVELNVIQNADHGTVILRRTKDFAESLEHIWTSSQRQNKISSTGF